MDSLKAYWEKPWLRHLLFWITVFLFLVLSGSINTFGSYRYFYENYLLVVGTQIIAAYVCIYLLIPKFLNQGKPVQFGFWLLILLMALFAVYMAVREFYFDPAYGEFYNSISKKYLPDTYLERLLDFSVFLSKCLLFLTPTALLLMLRFYRNQRHYLKLNEQKKVAELTALKHQLNPHFLFNTLNNLYSLALKKSDRTAEVIERLSGILDYILYRCNDTYVPLKNEVGLIENYLALEKVRYGERVAISFENSVDSEVKIAPLLLLTFIENAFKHGVSQELKKAKISISITLEGADIVFSIVNTKPKILGSNVSENEHIGLNNINQQLNLIYPNAHSLQIDEKPDTYAVTLKLAQK